MSHLMSLSGVKRTSRFALQISAFDPKRTCWCDSLPRFILEVPVPYAWEFDVTDYIFFMHDDASDGENYWEPYLAKLKNGGSFEGGSAIGNGVCVRKSGVVPSLTTHLTGYIRVNANNLDHAKTTLAGNPHFESGGTVEIRELPRTD